MQNLAPFDGTEKAFVQLNSGWLLARVFTLWFESTQISLQELKTQERKSFFFLINV